MLDVLRRPIIISSAPKIWIKGVVDDEDLVLEAFSLFVCLMAKDQDG